MRSVDLLRECQFRGYLDGVADFGLMEMMVEGWMVFVRCSKVASVWANQARRLCKLRSCWDVGQCVYFSTPGCACWVRQQRDKRDVTVHEDWGSYIKGRQRERGRLDVFILITTRSFEF